MWAKDDPAYRHVQVDGEPAVAKMGRQKKDKQVQATQPDQGRARGGWPVAVALRTTAEAGSASPSAS